MTTTASDATREGAGMDWKLELVIVPVADLDRAKTFYTEKVGFNVLVDHQAGEDFRVVQLTPPGSACSIALMKNVEAAGSVEGLHLVVSAIEAARGHLVDRAVEVDEPFHMGPSGQAPGFDPQRQSYNSFLPFHDPDGNGWLVQEVR